MSKLKVHPSVTERMVMTNMMRRMMTLDNPGICIACGNEQEGVEPDAQKYECDACGEHEVYGPDECFMQGLFHPA